MKRESDNLRAAIYARVSTPQQAAEDKDSLPSQVRDLRAIAETHGWQIVDEYQDPGITGETVEGRPALMRLLADVGAGKVDVVMVRALDRLARDNLAGAQINRALRIARVKLWAGGALQDLDNLQDELIVTILSGVATFDKRGLVQRMHRGRREAAAKGKVAVGRAAYGYRYDKANRTLVIVEEQAGVVRLIFRWYVDEKLGVLPIIRRLAALGIPSPAADRVSKPKVRRDGPEVNPKTGQPKPGWYSKMVDGKEVWCHDGWKPSGEWTKDTVATIIANPVYMGQFQTFKGSDPITIDVPAIVDEETWRNAQRELQERTATRGVSVQRYPYLLPGRVVCGGRDGACGAKWRCKTYRTKFAYYSCSTIGNARQAYRPCDTKSARAEALDTWVWERVRDALRDSTLLADALSEQQAAAMVDGAALESDLRQMESKLQGKAGEREKVISMARRDIITEADMLREIGDIQREHADLQSQCELLRRRLSDSDFERQRVATWRQFAERILPALDSLSFDERRQLVEALDVTVTVDALHNVEIGGCLALPMEGVKAHETGVYFERGMLWKT